jgi:hypothetical protein
VFIATICDEVGPASVDVALLMNEVELSDVVVDISVVVERAEAEFGIVEVVWESVVVVVVLKVVTEVVEPGADTVGVVLFATDTMVEVVVEVVYTVETTEEPCVLDVLLVFKLEVDPLACSVEELDGIADDAVTAVVLGTLIIALEDVKVALDKEDNKLEDIV